MSIFLWSCCSETVQLHFCGLKKGLLNPEFLGINCTMLQLFKLKLKGNFVLLV